jgi:hypothetical protein
LTWIAPSAAAIASRDLRWTQSRNGSGRFRLGTIHQLDLPPALAETPPLLGETRTAMFVHLLLPILLGIASGPVAPAQSASADHIMEISIPPAESAPAANIQLAHFEYVIPRAAPNSAPDYDQMLILQKGTKLAAQLTLASSQSTFGVRLIYALTADKPAQLRMQVAQAPAVETARLKEFYQAAGELTDFHCKHGTVYVMFDYRVSPAAAAGKRAKAH